MKEENAIFLILYIPLTIFFGLKKITIAEYSICFLLLSILTTLIVIKKKLK